MNTEPVDEAWARAHRACFQVGPLVEMRGQEKVQVGFTLDLYAAVPMDKPAGPERSAESDRIVGRLHAILQSLIPPEGGKARVEIEPRQAGAYLRPENALAPELGLRARIFHADQYFKAVTSDERTRLGAVERKLGEMGLRAHHW
jgi:hypothetical protein